MMKPQHHITPQWLTMEGACKDSGLSDGTLRAYIRGGHVVSAMVVLPGNHRGRRLISRPSLDAFIESYVVGPKRHANQQKKSLLTLLSAAAEALTEARKIAADLQEHPDHEFPPIL